MSRYGPRIAALERRALRERARLDADGPAVHAAEAGHARAGAAGAADDSVSAVGDRPTRVDEVDPAAAYLRAGVGPAVWLYVEGRTGGRRAPFSAAELSALERAMNAWLECYARCHGVDLEAAFSIRQAAELLLETRNVHDVGQLLTGVAPREREDRDRAGDQ